MQVLDEENYYSYTKSYTSCNKSYTHLSPLVFIKAQQIFKSNYVSYDLLRSFTFIVYIQRNSGASAVHSDPDNILSRVFLYVVQKAAKVSKGINNRLYSVFSHIVKQ